MRVYVRNVRCGAACCGKAMRSGGKGMARGRKEGKVGKARKNCAGSVVCAVKTSGVEPKAKGNA